CNPLALLGNFILVKDSIDYSLWDVIINGDSPVPTVIVEGAIQPTAILTVKQMLERRNKLKARGYYSKSDCETLSPSSLSDRSQPSGEYHAVPPPITRNFMPPKLDLVFHTAPIAVETTHSAFTIQPKDESEPNDPQSAPSFVQTSKHAKLFGHSVLPTQLTPRNSAHRGYDKQYAYALSTKKYPQKHIVPATVITKSKPVSVTAARPGTYSICLTFTAHDREHILSAFGGNSKGGKITGKGKIKTSKLDFEDVYFVNELKFNLFSVSQMCDKKNKVLFTDSECLVLSPDFKLPDENQVLLRVPRENYMYNVNLKDIVPSRDLTCLFAKATNDESNLWHRRLGHVNLKNINKLLKGNLVTGLPTKVFENQNNCVACLKGNQHRASCKTKPVSSITQPLFRLYMDLFRPNVIKSLSKKCYCLVIIDDYSRFTWDFFLATKDETSSILKTFFTSLENQLSLRVKNKEGDATFDGNEHSTEHPESTVNLSPSSSALSGEQDDITKKRHKGKSLVNYFTRNRDFNEDFEDYSEDSSNDVSTAGHIVLTARQNYFNITNLISAIGPSNSNTSPIHGNYSFQDASKSHDIPENEDIVYSDHENVGAEADFNNLDTSITDERGIVVRNKARFIAQGHTQEEGIDYEEVFAPVARIEAIRLVLAYASFMGFMVYQMDVKSAFLYGTIEEEVYVCQPSGFEDPDHPDKVKQKEDGIFINQDKYVAEILKKFGLTKGKSASNPIDTEKPLLKDPDGEDVDVHIYRSMIGSLMYLTSSRQDIMFAVCTCARFQVTLKVSHLHAVKRIFRFLKGKPNLGLGYLKDSPFDLVAYSDSDYAGASLDRKSNTRGCQFLGSRLISWQCKKQIVIATSSTKAEYVAGSSCCTQVLWIQNQMLDYRLQALVKKKRVVVTEAAIRDALHLDDAEGVDCLPNEEIFTELARMEEQGDEEEHGTDNVVAEEPDIAVDDVADQSIQSPTPLTPPPQQPQDIPSTSQRIESSDDTLMEDVSNQGREFNRAKDVVKETKEVREYTVDTQVKRRQADICHIDMDHAAKVLSMQEKESEVQEAVEKRKLIEEAKEAESIKQHLQIVPDEDDDVFTEATLLARKVPVVDYQVILVNNKPRYKIIKADDTHQLYASFITMLKFFDREDLETLRRIVKERFSTSKPNNFSDEYLLTALKTMFERPDRQDNVWRNQSTIHGQAFVKS
nr:ribonuclease H-like domain-containing protein [Tanacetum cinerariifolium]